MDVVRAAPRAPITPEVVCPEPACLMLAKKERQHHRARRRHEHGQRERGKEGAGAVPGRRAGCVPLWLPAPPPAAKAPRRLRRPCGCMSLVWALTPQTWLPLNGRDPQILPHHQAGRSTVLISADAPEPPLPASSPSCLYRAHTSVLVFSIYGAGAAPPDVLQHASLPRFSLEGACQIGQVYAGRSL